MIDAGANASTPDASPPLQLHVPATASFQERHAHALKDGNGFAVFDRRGDIGGELDGAEGVFRDDTRVLSRFELRLDGERPLLLSTADLDDSAAFTADLTNVDRYDGETLALARESIHLNRLVFLRDGVLFERVTVRNFDEREHRLTLSFAFDADFADVFEVRGERRTRRGRLELERRDAATVAFAYRALDDVRTTTLVAFEPVPDVLTLDEARFELVLPAGASARVLARAGRPSARDAGIARAFFTSLRGARRAIVERRGRAVAIASSSAAFDEVLKRSSADLAMLESPTDVGPYPDAGIPWFATPFGRDGIVTALFTLWLDPALARGVLRFLAETQATKLDPVSDAEPGKILHEMRAGEMARLGEVPFARYYGSVDATPLFLMLLGAYFERTGDLALVRDLWPNACAALAWLDTYGDLDGDGFVEYARKTASGLDNQGWKDSRDSIFHADGTLARTPIALCEVQGYTFAGKLAAANLAHALGERERARALRMQAEALRARFEAAFWSEELGTYALALDADKRRCEVVASNAGHALFCGIADRERAVRVSQTLLGSSGFSGWGIRTVARSAARYNPMSYHNGSVWPHDNALIALGFARYGLKREVARVFEAMMGTAAAMEAHRLPELFCGFDRRKGASPTLYPVACSPQAWASATPFALLAASLGIGFDVGAGVIRFDRPSLPPSLGEVNLRGLRLGDASVDVHVRRIDDELAVGISQRRGGDVGVTVTH